MLLVSFLACCTLQKRRLQKKQQCTSVVIARLKILGFHLGEIPISQNNAYNKAIARYN
jgi:hypothetical protein